MVWLSGITDYAQAEEILQKVGQMNVSDSSIWRQAQEWGERFRALEEEEQGGKVVAGRWGGPLRVPIPKGRMGVAMDGGMIHIRGEGWKEVKVGCVFDVELEFRQVIFP